MRNFRKINRHSAFGDFENSNESRISLPQKARLVCKILFSFDHLKVKINTLDMTSFLGEIQFHFGKIYLHRQIMFWDRVMS